LQYLGAGTLSDNSLKGDSHVCDERASGERVLRAQRRWTMRWRR